MTQQKLLEDWLAVNDTTKAIRRPGLQSVTQQRLLEDWLAVNDTTEVKSHVSLYSKTLTLIVVHAVILVFL